MAEVRELQDAGRFDGSIEMLREILESDPDSAEASYRLGLALVQIGEPLQAVWPLQNAVRGASQSEIDAGIQLASIHFGGKAAVEAARIFLALGRYDEATSFSSLALRDPNQEYHSDAYIVAARAHTGIARFQRARQAVDQLATLGDPAIAARELALVLAAQAGPAVSADALLDSGLDFSDPANLVALEQLSADLASLNRLPEALDQIEAAIAKHPENAELLELYGLSLMRDRRRLKPARVTLEQSLALESDRPKALAGLATLVANDGEFARSLELLDRAYALDPFDGQPAYLASQFALASGDRTDAIRRLREIVRQHPEIPDAANDLAWYLAESGQDLELALLLAERARERNPTPPVLDTLGWIHLKRGDVKQAVALLEQALEARPRSPSIRYHLGVALLEAGDTQPAREMLESSLNLGNFAEADQAREALAKLKP